MKLTIFYDGFCPLCMIEMNKLSQLNTQGKLGFVDIQSAHFEQAYPQISFQAANDKIHGLTDAGEIITGLDVTYQAWKLVGKGWVYAPLRWRLIAPLMDKIYIIFAKHRYKISYWITRKERCETCQKGTLNRD